MMMMLLLSVKSIPAKASDPTPVKLLPMKALVLDLLVVLFMIAMVTQLATLIQKALSLLVGTLFMIVLAMLLATFTAMVMLMLPILMALSIPVMVTQLVMGLMELWRLDLSAESCMTVVDTQLDTLIQKAMLLLVEPLSMTVLAMPLATLMKMVML